MQHAFEVAPEGLAAVAPRLHRELEVLGRCRVELARVLAEIAELLAGRDTALEVDGLSRATTAASSALAGAITRLEAALVGAARRYAGVEALVTVAERVSA